MTISTRARSFALLSVLSLGLGCRSGDDKQQAPDAAAVAAPVVALPPLAAPPAAVLPVPGYGNAVLISPAGATKAMPLVVAVLGIGDTPEAQCAVWRELVGQRAFVICPRFTPHYVPAQQETESIGQGLLGLFGLQGPQAPSADPNAGGVVQSGFRPTEVPAVESEIDAAVASARRIIPRHIAPGPVLYIGFSRGAFLGASIVARAPGKYARAILIEGGQTAWTDASAAAFAKGGGKRVLFACGQPSCVAESTPAAQLLGRVQIPTRIVDGEGQGHGYNAQVKEQIRQALGWVIEGDPTWR